jgi:hypothetical protein
MRMHRFVQERERAIQVVCVQAVAIYGNEFQWDQRETSRQEDLHLLLNWQARSTLGALPSTSLGELFRDLGQTPVPVALDSRQQRFTARLANACAGSKLKETYNHPTSGSPICRVIKNEHE